MLQNLLSDDNETTTGDEEEGPVESEYDELGKEESSPGRHGERKKRKVKEFTEFAVVLSWATSESGWSGCSLRSFCVL